MQPERRCGVSLSKSGYERAGRMKWSRTSGLVRKRRRHLPARGHKGFVLIELLVSIAIFGVISVGFLSALVAGYHGVIVAHDMTTAESLTRTTFENVRNAGFPIVDYQTNTSKFDVLVHADNITEDYTVVNAASDLQMITVTVRYHDGGRTLLDTEMTKVR
jgi:prepilin-type N-terminal cleavage/methylation domain-containing protein